jgi:hypothetical protein
VVCSIVDSRSDSPWGDLGEITEVTVFRIFTTGKASHCTSRENDAPDKSLAGDT